MLGIWLTIGGVVALIAVLAVIAGRRGGGAPADHRNGEGSAMGALAYLTRQGGPGSGGDGAG